jgi:hypothetical protein
MMLVNSYSSSKFALEMQCSWYSSLRGQNLQDAILEFTILLTHEIVYSHLFLKYMPS